MFKGAFSIWGRDMLVLTAEHLFRAPRGRRLSAHPLSCLRLRPQGVHHRRKGIPYATFHAPGLISMTAVNAAFDESSWSMWFHRKVQHTIEEYRVNPITVYDIVIGKIMSGFSQGAIKGGRWSLVIILLTPFRIPLLPPRRLPYLHAFSAP